MRSREERRERRAARVALRQALREAMEASPDATGSDLRELIETALRTLLADRPIALAIALILLDFIFPED